MRNIAGLFLIGGSALVFVTLLLLSDGASNGQSTGNVLPTRVKVDNISDNAPISRLEPIPSYDRVEKTDLATRMIAIEKQKDVEGINPFLKDRSAEVRAKAAYKLWEFRSPEAMAKLKSLEGDPDAKVRAFVKSVLSANISRSSK